MNDNKLETHFRDSVLEFKREPKAIVQHIHNLIKVTGD